MRYTRLTLLAGVIAMTPLWAQNADEDEGGSFLEGVIEDALSGPGFEVDVVGFQGALSSRASIASIIISDDEGPWLTINDAVLDWTRSALLRGRLEVSELTAGEILVPRVPQSEPSASIPSAEATPFSLPDIPVSINIDAVKAGRIAVGEPLFGEAAVVSLDGAASLVGGALDVAVEIMRIDGPEGAFSIVAQYANEGQQLLVDLEVAESADGIVANLIDLPGRPSVEASVKGDGALSDFTADIRLATDGAERLAGTVTLSEDAEGGQGFGAQIGGDIAPVLAPAYGPFFGPDVALDLAGVQGADGVLRLDQFALRAQALDVAGRAVIGADGVPDIIDLEGEIAGPNGPILLPGSDNLRVDRVTLDVAFDASVSEDWTGDIVIDGFSQPGLRIDQLALEGAGRIAGTGASLAIDAGFDFRAAGLQPDDPAFGEALGQQIAGRADIGFRAGAPIELERITLNGASFKVEGSGNVDPAGENVPLSLDMQADIAQLSAFSALAGRDLAGQLSAQLTLTAEALSGAFDVALDGLAEGIETGIPQLDPLLTDTTSLTLRADRDETGTRVETLNLGNPRVRLTGAADINSETGQAELTARLTDLSDLDAALTGPAAMSLSADRNAQGWDIALDADGAGGVLDAAGRIGDLEAASPFAEGRFSASLSALDRFSALVGRDLAGAFDVSGSFRGRADLSEAQANLDGTLADLALGIDAADALLAGQTQIEADISKAGAAIRLPTFRVVNPQIAVTGEGSYTRDGGAFDVDIRLVDLALILPELSGPAALALDARGTAEIWDITLDGQGESISLEGTGQISDFAGGAAPFGEGAVQLTATNLEVFSELAGRDLGGQTALAIEGSARFDGSEIDLAVAGTTRDLRVGQPELNRLLAGQTALDVDFAKSGDVLNLSSLSLENGQITLTADGRYGPGDSAIQANVTMPDLGSVIPEMSGDARVVLFAEQVNELWQISLDGDGAGVMLDVLAEVEGLESEAPEMRGNVTFEAEALSRFQRLAGRDLGGSVTLNAEGFATLDGSSFDVTTIAQAQNLRIGEPQVDQLLRGRTVLAVEATRAAAAEPIRVARFELDSSGLDARAQGTMLGGQSDLDLSAELANLGVFVEGLNGPLSLTGRAGEAGSNLSLDIDITGPAGITADVSGQVARDFARANLDIDGVAPLRLVGPFIAPRSVNGTARFDLGVNGPLALSSLSGTVATNDARVVLPSLGIVLDRTEANVRLNGQQAVLDVTAFKQAGGRLDVAGPIGLTPGYVADLTIRLDDVVFQQAGLYETELDGRIAVAGPLTGGARISGRLSLDDTEVRIPSTGLGATGPIPDGLLHVNEPADVRATRSRAGLIENENDGASGTAGGGAAYPIDLVIRTDDSIFVRGRGLDAELSGGVSLTGTTADLIPAGQFNLIRGRLDLLGQRLDLTEGEINLRGNFSPFVRFVAETDAGEVLVRITVEGDVSEPEIEFSSEPELPEDEVLAQLLFGRSIDQISPLQALQLAQAVATLAGRGGDGIVANVREGVGLDDLDVTSDAEGNVGVRAGAYLSENIYTDVTVDAQGQAEVNLNLDISNSVTLRGSASNNGDAGLGVFFERDY